MRKTDLRDLAPEFKVKNDGWKSRWYTWSIAAILFVAVSVEAVRSAKAIDILENTPGISDILRKMNVLKP